MTANRSAKGRENLGIFGGSFDPPHLGHLGIAEEARARFHLDRVIFVPAGQPPHKRSGTAAGRFERFEMVRLAVAGNPHFETSDIEMRRHGPSYTIDTLGAFRKLYPRARIFFIAGADSLVELPKWHRARELVRRFDFLIVKRPGSKPAYRAVLEKAFGKRQALKLEAHFIHAGPYNISATEIRNRIAAGESIRYLVPQAVERYILKKGLYR